MHSRKTLAGGIILGSAVFASNAHAATPFPGERPAPPRIERMMNQEVWWWLDRGVRGGGCLENKTITAWVADSLSGPRVGGEGFSMGLVDEPTGTFLPWEADRQCKMFIRSDQVEGSRSALRCLVKHEVGHVLGLWHTDADKWAVMDGTVKMYEKPECAGKARAVTVKGWVVPYAKRHGGQIIVKRGRIRG